MNKNYEKNVDKMLRELGHPANLSGTALLRRAACIYEPGMMMTKDLYPALARAVDSTPARVERCMRHSIETAWMRSPLDVQLRWFGNTVDPQRGKPTVGEYVATLAHICREGLLDED